MLMMNQPKNNSFNFHLKKKNKLKNMKPIKFGICLWISTLIIIFKKILLYIENNMIVQQRNCEHQFCLKICWKLKLIFQFMIPRESHICFRS